MMPRGLEAITTVSSPIRFTVGAETQVAGTAEASAAVSTRPRVGPSTELVSVWAGS